MADKVSNEEIISEKPAKLPKLDSNLPDDTVVDDSAVSTTLDSFKG